MSAEQSAAELFANDLMKIIAERLSLEVRQVGDTVQVVLYDERSGVEISSCLIALQTTKNSFTDKNGTRRDYVEDIGLRPDW